MNTRGYSLLEVCVVLCIAGILGTIATISFSGTKLDIQKRQLKTSADLFALAVKNCVLNVGSWEFAKADGTKIKPCEATTQADLLKKLKFTCPADATCSALVSDQKTGFCLNIKKTVSEQKLQVVSIVELSNTSNYVVYCGEPKKDFEPVLPASCNISPNIPYHFSQVDNLPVYGDDGQTPKTDDDGNIIYYNKLMKDCTNWKSVG